MSRPHIAAIAEDGWNWALGGALRAGGWRHLIVTHTGYANEREIRVLARVLLAPDDVRRDYRSERWSAAQAGRRGWRNFFVVDALGAEVTITVGDVEHVTTVDRSGYVDARIPNPGL